MWLDEEGVFHTTAHPSPSALMSDVFRHGLENLLAKDVDAVEMAVAGEEEKFFEEGFSNSLYCSSESAFVGVVPSKPILLSPILSINDLRAAIEGVEPRWRLDAVLAIEDYASGFEGHV